MLASALGALAAWPLFQLSHRALPKADAVALPTAAPVIADYRSRDRIVAVFEASARRDATDQIISRMLAAQYLQRYRESGDVGDLLRARRMAQRSLTLQPQHNSAAEAALSTVALSFHDIPTALRYAQDVARMSPWSAGARANVASLEMERGDYAAAAQLLSHAPTRDEDPGWDAVAARYAELTGNLAASRRLMHRAMAQADSVIDNPAEGRAWYHWRAGQLAFKAGDLGGAESGYREALALFPDYARAYDSLAQLYAGQHLWREALEAATRGADLIPLPVTLGYKSDAQRALGDTDGAAQTDDLIFAIERLGNIKGINDRLIALYYADHGLRLSDAVKIARRDLRRRDDIYSEDTLGWALAKAGRWDEARLHAERAARYDTEDSLLQYHTGVIELHFGQRQQAGRRLRMALALNPAFHPAYANSARQLLKTL